MLKTLTVPLLAASLALTPMAAAPAYASGDELAKVLGGLALLAIIGAAVNDANAHPAPVPPPYVHPVPPRPVHPAPPPGYHVKRPLPAQCRERIRERGVDVAVYGKHCVDQAMRHSPRLPDICEDTVNIFGRATRVYRAQCLRRLGWPV